MDNMAERGIAALIGRLPEEAVSHGLGDRTASRYRASCSDIARFAEETGETEWSDGFAGRYLARLDSRVAEGKMRPKRRTTQERMVRLLSSLADTGTADFSRAPVPSGRYPVDGGTAEVVARILAESGLRDDAAADLRAPVRHLLWYAASRGLGPMELDDATVMDFVVGEIPVSNPGSKGLAMRAVTVATEWLRSNGNDRLARDWSRLKVRGGGRRIVPAYTEREISSMVTTADPTTPRGARDRAIVLVSYCTGLRGHDVLRIRLSDVDWRRQCLTVSQSKTHAPITCALNGETMNALADYVLDARPECDVPEVFVTLNRPWRPLARGTGGIVEDLCDASGVAKVPRRSSHSLRRAFETGLVSRGVPIETASQMMGHGDIESDKPYITHDAATTSLVSLGLECAPVTAGVYLARGGDAR